MTPGRTASATALLAVLLGLGACSGKANPGNDDGGTSSLGEAPVISATPATTSPSDPASPAGSGSSAGVDLRASYRVSKGSLGVTTTVAVTITNEGTVDSTGWTVAIRLSKIATLNLQSGPGVNHESRDGQEIFTPAGEGAVLSPGSVLTFTFEVRGLDVNVASCSIDQKPCRAA